MGNCDKLSNFHILENSCFNNDLHTDITVDDEIKTSNVDIPQIPSAFHTEGWKRLSSQKIHL